MVSAIIGTIGWTIAIFFVIASIGFVKENKGLQDEKERLKLENIRLRAKLEDKE
ncbi:hypothetical protein [Miniphocaeibacter massiliensis]|uniref:hypothetical protein n=1 Tax=Miniphocaeibacter massiliensis TaxID=2041841 RepID=UPI0013EE3320|nr:hypothetical protein [Miniphocaeibacter massiliensis]